MQGAVIDVEAGSLWFISIAKAQSNQGCNGQGDERMEHIATAMKEQSAASESVANSLERVASLVDNNAQSAKDAKPRGRASSHQ